MTFQCNYCVNDLYAIIHKRALIAYCRSYLMDVTCCIIDLLFGSLPNSLMRVTLVWILIKDTYSAKFYFIFQASNFPTTGKGDPLFLLFILYCNLTPLQTNVLKEDIAHHAISGWAFHIWIWLMWCEIHSMMSLPTVHLTSGRHVRPSSVSIGRLYVQRLVLWGAINCSLLQHFVKILNLNKLN